MLEANPENTPVILFRKVIHNRNEYAYRPKRRPISPIPPPIPYKPKSFLQAQTIKNFGVDINCSPTNFNKMHAYSIARKMRYEHL